jgi:hypothetical protein
MGGGEPAGGGEPGGGEGPMSGGGAGSGPEPGGRPVLITIPMPEAASMLATHKPIRLRPSTRTHAPWRRARIRAPPSPSPCARAAVASSGASRVRRPCGIARKALPGKSCRAPPAASSVMIRSATSAEIPNSLAAARSWARSRLPSRRPSSTAAPRIPVKAMARRGSTPIWTVSRLRQTASKPGLRAGLMGSIVTRRSDILDGVVPHRPMTPRGGWCA